MPEPYLSEIWVFPFAFAPKGFALCNGQLLPINQNQALFSLLGTTYGGNGQTTFGLPNLQGRVPVHVGSGFTQGQAAGETAHTLNAGETPAHTHFLQANSTPATVATPAPAGTAVLAGASLNLYSGFSGGVVPLAADAISNVGGSQAHSNLQPFTVLSFCIATVGLFPSRN